MHSKAEIVRDSVVLGTDLASVIYAYLTNSDMIFTGLEAPNEFEFLPTEFETSIFNLPNAEIRVKSHDGYASFGFPKIELWNHLLFVMSAAGRLPFGATPVSVNRRENTLEIKTRAKKYHLGFSKIKSFSNNYHGHRVYDWFSVRSCGPHDLQYYAHDDDFIKEIFFYPSSRPGASSNLKDVLTISYLEEDELSDFSFGPTMARMKTVHMMESLGIKGKKNGKNPNYPDRGDPHFYLTIKLEHRERQTRSIKTNNNEYNMVRDFLKKEKDYNANSYLWQLNKKLFAEDLLIK